MMHVSVFGLGYVGSVTAASLARDGHQVIGVDLDRQKVDAINDGRAPVVEPGLAELMAQGRAAGRLMATTSVAEAVAQTSLALVCVGTPTGPEGKPDMRALWRVGDQVGHALRRRRDVYTVVMRSTVLPGTTEGGLAGAIELAGADMKRIRLAVNPEFMREGSALKDFVTPPYTLIGCPDAETAFVLRLLYSGVDAPVVETTIRVAEMLKFVSNAFHAVKICFTNEVSALCDTLGVDASEVMRIFRLDRKLNISEAYLQPGYAFGGSCLPKDVRALAYATRSTDVGAPLLSSVLPSNQLHLQRGVNAVLATGRRKVGVLGLAFKPGSDDVRESPLVTLVERLLGHGCEVRVLDRCVAASAPVGANRAHLEKHLPNLATLLCRDVPELCGHADVLVLGHTGADAEEAVRLAGADCLVINLCGSPSNGRATALVPAASPRARARALGSRLSTGLLLVGLVGALSPARAASAAPALPSATIDTPAVTTRGQVRRVVDERELQAALLAANPGDTVLLEAGATYVGPFVMPKKDGDAWITIRGARPPVPPGQRVHPSQANAMPKLESATGAVLVAAPGAHHYHFVGVEIRPAPGSFLHNLVVLGDAGREAADVPHHFVFDRCYLHGDPVVGARRGIALNAAHAAVVDSYLADFKEVGTESQAIAGWAGPGPFLIRNNYLEAAGENVMFGGADPPSRHRIPSDIYVRGNHFAKPLRWKADEPVYEHRRFTVKNLFELKDARRVLVEGNLFEHNWPDAQSGFAILFTVRNQDGRAPWSAVEDVTFRGNIVRRTAAGVNLLGRDDARGGDSGQTRRILIRDNLFYDVGGPRWGGGGTLFQLLEGTAEVTIEHNTAFQSGNVITADGAPHQGFVFRDNVVAHNVHGIMGSGRGVGQPALSAYFPGGVVRRNVLAGGQKEQYPPDNFFPSELDKVVLLDGTLGVVRLAAKSPYRGAGTDGRDLGADPDALQTAMRACEP